MSVPKGFSIQAEHKDSHPVLFINASIDPVVIRSSHTALRLALPRSYVNKGAVDQTKGTHAEIGHNEASGVQNASGSRQLQSHHASEHGAQAQSSAHHKSDRETTLKDRGTAVTAGMGASHQDSGSNAEQAAHSSNESHSQANAEANREANSHSSADTKSHEAAGSAKYNANANVLGLGGAGMSAEASGRSADSSGHQEAAATDTSHSTSNQVANAVGQAASAASSVARSVSEAGRMNVGIKQNNVTSSTKATVADDRQSTSSRQGKAQGETSSIGHHQSMGSNHAEGLRKVTSDRASGNQALEEHYLDINYVLGPQEFSMQLQPGASEKVHGRWFEAGKLGPSYTTIMHPWAYQPPDDGTPITIVVFLPGRQYKVVSSDRPLLRCIVEALPPLIVPSPFGPVIRMLTTLLGQDERMLQEGNPETIWLLQNLDSRHIPVSKGDLLTAWTTMLHNKRRNMPSFVAQFLGVHTVLEYPHLPPGFCVEGHGQAFNIPRPITVRAPSCKIYNATLHVEGQDGDAAITVPLGTSLALDMCTINRTHPRLDVLVLEGGMLEGVYPLLRVRLPPSGLKVAHLSADYIISKNGHDLSDTHFVFASGAGLVINAANVSLINVTVQAAPNLLDSDKALVQTGREPFNAQAAPNSPDINKALVQINREATVTMADCRVLDSAGVGIAMDGKQLTAISTSVSGSRLDNLHIRSGATVTLTQLCKVQNSKGGRGVFVELGTLTASSAIISDNHKDNLHVRNLNSTAKLTACELRGSTHASGVLVNKGGVVHVEAGGITTVSGNAECGVAVDSAEFTATNAVISRNTLGNVVVQGTMNIQSTLTNCNLDGSTHGSGVYVCEGGKVTINVNSGSTHSSNGNGISGVWVQDSGSQVTINVTEGSTHSINGNETYGVCAKDSGKLTVNASGGCTHSINSNKGWGVYMTNSGQVTLGVTDGGQHTISHNQKGGVLAVSCSAVTATNTTISNNSLTNVELRHRGSTAVLTNCQLLDSRTGYGAAVWHGSNLAASGTHISGNKRDNVNVFGEGSAAQLTNCDMNRNHGSGLCAHEGGKATVNVTDGSTHSISDNDQCGVAIKDSGSQVTINGTGGSTHSISDNKGSGMHVAHNGQVTVGVAGGSTHSISDNKGSGVWVTDRGKVMFDATEDSKHTVHGNMENGVKVENQGDFKATRTTISHNSSDNAVLLASTAEFSHCCLADSVAGRGALVKNCSSLTATETEFNDNKRNNVEIGPSENRKTKNSVTLNDCKVLRSRNRGVMIWGGTLTATATLFNDSYEDNIYMFSGRAILYDGCELKRSKTGRGALVHNDATLDCVGKVVAEGNKEGWSQIKRE